MDIRAEFEAWVETQSESMECIYELFLSEDERGNYVDGITQTAFMAFKAGQASRQALSSCSEIPNSSDPDSRQGLEGESVEYQFYHDAKWHNFIDDAHRYNTEKAGYPVRARYTHPASESKGRIEGDKSGYGRIADSKAVSVPKQWVDLMRELVKDLISEIKTKQKLKPDERVAEDLGAVREAIAMIAKQEQGHE